MSILETTAVAANIALALSLIVGLVFGIAQVNTARRDRRERLTINVIQNFQTRGFSELILYITSQKMPASRDELRVLPEHERINFVEFAQQMESLGILVAEGLVNLDLVDKTLGDFVSNSWQKYKPVMLDMREKQPDPFLAEYFQWLAERIDQRMKNNPRKPFHEDSSTAKCIE
jgi:hypothetical protein